MFDHWHNCENGGHGKLSQFHSIFSQWTSSSLQNPNILATLCIINATFVTNCSKFLLAFDWIVVLEWVFGFCSSWMFSAVSVFETSLQSFLFQNHKFGLIYCHKVFPALSPLNHPPQELHLKCKIGHVYAGTVVSC